jgi:hypothetical protein
MSSNIILIGEHHYELPAFPTTKSEILFIDHKPEDAYWRRLTDYRDIWFQFIPYFTKLYQSATIYDQDERLISLNTDDSNYIIRIYEQEMHRRRHGVWFKNKDQITYLTGNHYFLLQWAKMQRLDGIEYADYREFQRDYFYLIDHCWRYKYILGLDLSKPKKTGITNLHWSGYYLNKATMSKNRNLGAMNLDITICAKMFRDYFMYSFNGLPPAFKPLVKSKSEMDGSIIYGRLHTASKKMRASSNTDDGELNTSVFCVPTKPKAFDVALMSDAWIDEDPKIKNIGEIFRTNKESVKIQDVFNGRLWMTSYTPDEDTQAFREAREIFFDSELRTITPHSGNQTKTGMICHHIPAYAAWEGCFNKHGQCNEKEAMSRNQTMRNNAKGNSRNLQAITRQYANDKREAWSTAGAGSVFDNIRLGELLADIEIDHRDATENPYQVGRLEWTNPLWESGLRNRRRKGEFCPVKFVPLTEQELARGDAGKIRIYRNIPISQQNIALKYGRDEWNNLLPPPIFLTFGGGDPTNYAAGSEIIEGSRNASYTMSAADERLDSLLKKVSSKIILSEYFARPELPDEAFEDFLKEIIYFGKLNIIEANAPYVATRLLEEGLGYYMIVKDENGILTTWKRHMGLPHEPEKSYQLIRTTANSNVKEILETIVRLIKNYIERPRVGEKDYGKTIQSERLLKQLMDFDAEDTKMYDLVMAWGYCLLCYEIYYSVRYNPEDDYSNPKMISAVLGALAA